jgi:hypothetical protein
MQTIPVQKHSYTYLHGSTSIGIAISIVTPKPSLPHTITLSSGEKLSSISSCVPA